VDRLTPAAAERSVRETVKLVEQHTGYSKIGAKLQGLRAPIEED
jgi:hypothetical protein